MKKFFDWLRGRREPDTRTIEQWADDEIKRHTREQYFNSVYAVIMTFVFMGFLIFTGYMVWDIIQYIFKLPPIEDLSDAMSLFIQLQFLVILFWIFTMFMNENIGSLFLAILNQIQNPTLEDKMEILFRHHWCYSLLSNATYLYLFTLILIPTGSDFIIHERALQAFCLIALLLGLLLYYFVLAVLLSDSLFDWKVTLMRIVLGITIGYGFAFGALVSYEIIVTLISEPPEPLGVLYAVGALCFGYSALMISLYITIRFPHDPFIQIAIRWYNRKLRRENPRFESLPPEAFPLEYYTPALDGPEAEDTAP